jgi:hypothetical protein
MICAIDSAKLIFRFAASTKIDFSPFSDCLFPLLDDLWLVIYQLDFLALFWYIFFHR